MLFENLPIRKKLRRIIFLINGIVLLVTCITFFVYEYYIFRKSLRENLSTIGKIISFNSTAALAFDSPEDGKEILSALRSEPHIVAASLYDKDGKLFTEYTTGIDSVVFPITPGDDGYRYSTSHLEGFEPIVQDNRKLGTLYIKSDMGALYDRLKVYGLIVLTVLVVSFVLAYFLIKILKRSISTPILSLAKTAKKVTDLKDYSVRAVKMGNDEMGSLTDTFNQMLEQIEEQNQNLKDFNQNLEKKVSERTSQLESVNKELESFSYSVSHDLRAPLRAIIGFTTILEEDYGGKLDKEALRLTNVIKSNTVRMGQLIDDLLAFSRIGRQEIKKFTVDMDTMVNDVIESMDGVEKITWDIKPLPKVLANPGMIRQVWINLISNAVKYSRKTEKPKVEIGSFQKEQQMVFYVKDNGVGFDEQYKEKLFKVFQRLHSPADFEGTGIGLALVDKIVSRQGGTVWAEGKSNMGACFYFSLPVDLPKQGSNIQNIK
jgi:signal transduction histidine kinase